MKIRVRCSGCSTSLDVKRELAGKRGKCPKCGHVIQIPDAAPAVKASVAARTSAAAAAPAPKSRSTADTMPYEQRQAAILGAFQGTIKPVRVPLSYRLGILLVAAVMVLLPLIYIGFIALVAYGVYYHTVNHTGMLSAGRGRGAILVLLAYLAPLIVGVIAVVFMIKPLFARPSTTRRQRSVTRDGEPLLFTFVDRICEAVRAPRPRRIDLDCEVNASASFRRGVLSFLGNDLVLTIGMPLVAGLSLRQFGGVLAHEFGHFSQGAGMRLTYVIRSIAYWFHRVVYERDQWDQWLHDTARSLDIRLGWVLYLALLFVWVTRKLLFVLMLVGHVVAGYMLRQMEFDADRYEARLAGSEAFEKTARRLMVLNVANQGALSDLGTFYSEGRLGDNLPKLIQANVAQIPRKLLRQLQKSVDESRTGLFDTHPSDRDRIANAQREQAEGIFRLDSPARALFRDFDDASRKVTWDFYRGIFGPQLKPQELHPIDDLLRRQQLDQDAGRSFQRFFQGQFQLSRPLEVPEQIVPGAHDAAALRQAREALIQGLEGYKALRKKRSECLQKLVQAHQVLQVIDAGLKPSARDFACPTNSAGAQKTVRQCETALLQLDGQMSPWDALASRRLTAGLTLLFDDRVAAHVPGALAHQQRCRTILPALRILSTCAAQRLALQIEYAKLAVLLPYLQANSENQGFIEALLKQMGIVCDVANGLRAQFRDMNYPLDHAEANMTIARFLLKEPLLDKENLGQTYEGAEAMIDNIATLTGRAIAQLTLAAERVETALGLEPLPDPPEEEDESDE